MKRQELRGMKTYVIRPRAGRIPRARIAPFSARTKLRIPPAEVAKVEQKQPDPAEAFLRRRERRSRRRTQPRGTGARLTFLNID